MVRLSLTQMVLIQDSAKVYRRADGILGVKQDIGNNILWENCQHSVITDVDSPIPYDEASKMVAKEMLPRFTTLQIRELWVCPNKLELCKYIKGVIGDGVHLVVCKMMADYLW